MNLGIKCEIHDCTINLCHLLAKMGIIPEEYASILEGDKQLRIDNQYYLKNRDVPIDYDKIVEFILTMKNIGIKIRKDEMDKVRERIKTKEGSIR